MAQQRPCVVLIFGGQSTEHQVSCLTAAGIAKAIDTALTQHVADCPARTPKED